MRPVQQRGSALLALGLLRACTVWLCRPGAFQRRDSAATQLGFLRAAASRCALDLAAAMEEERPDPPRCPCGQASKYRCPGCSARSCSLACSRRHKADSGAAAPLAAASSEVPGPAAHARACPGCSGRRDRTAFMPLADFGDATLRSDFFLLEGAQRSREAARRALLKSRDAPASHSQGHDLIREVCTRGAPMTPQGQLHLDLHRTQRPLTLAAGGLGSSAVQGGPTIRHVAG